VSRQDRRLARLRLGQWFALTTGLLFLVALVGLVLGLLALSRLSDARALLADRLDPATTAALRLDAAMLNEESGIRGYLLTGRDAFLEPWTNGRHEQLAARAALGRFATGAEVGQLRRDLHDVDSAISDWLRGYARPVISSVRTGDSRRIDTASLALGKVTFDRVRAALGTAQINLRTARASARVSLDHAATTVLVIFVAFGVALLLAVITATVTLQRVAIRPLHQLVGRVRRVARGEFHQTVEVNAATEIVRLARDIDSMRRRIVAEAEDLQRSNAELEQFAYVASHDLQEPLRKVASFCQLLQSRYGGQLDERADQYIGFAVDGAKRMQDLINDLLAFSRVGRVGSQLTTVDLDAIVRAAQDNLAARIEESGASVEIGPLPTVQGDPGLLTLVFQNLIGNAIKFRGEAPPQVRIEASPDGVPDRWEVRVSDNGIGIDPEYGERIFVIFQRLHSRATYDGTGIGLAMCRKIVEHHGGRIWLAERDEPGSTFCFTLPAERQETAR
jgi:signal transduction histidine kinase